MVPPPRPQRTSLGRGLEVDSSVGVSSIGGSMVKMVYYFRSCLAGWASSVVGRCGDRWSLGRFAPGLLSVVSCVLLLSS